VLSQADFLQTAATSRRADHLSWAASAISLLVGGIGIMNIMLFGGERTRGSVCASALGARKRDIRAVPDGSLTLT